MNRVSFLLIIVLTGCIYGCKKDSEEENCAAIQTMSIEAVKRNYYIGEEIYLKARSKDSNATAYFNWSHTNYLNDISNTPEVHKLAEKSDEGWFYVRVSYPGCSVHIDSIYISVKNNPVGPPCSPVNNTVMFSAIPDISPAKVSWAYDDGWKRRVLQAHGDFGYPDFKIYFNTFWDAKEPEDGEYNIVTMSATDAYPPYTVYVSSLYTGIFFQATGKVYVSHVNGKLNVSFCNIPLIGSSGGSTFKTTASGSLTAP